MYRCQYSLRLKVVLGLLLSLLVYLPLWGVPVTYDMAQQAARSVLEQEVLPDLRDRLVDIQSLHILTKTGRAQMAGDAIFIPAYSDVVAYVAPLWPQGFLVLSPSTDLTPVLAYSAESIFSWDESPLNALLHTLREDIRLRTAAVDAGLVYTSRNEEAWITLLADMRGNPNAAFSTTYATATTLYRAAEVGTGQLLPFVPWNQSNPYWNNCPIDPITGSRCVVGCTATALAQILNYWQYPTSITFQTGDSYTSFIDPDRISGNGDERTIWINAPSASFAGLNYDSHNPSDTAKADLSFAAGVSVRMGYSSVGSGAYLKDAACALSAVAQESVWGVRSGVWGYESASYVINGVEFHDRLAQNMLNALPALLSIRGKDKDGEPIAHAVVCDGYQIDSLDVSRFHINLGWGDASTNQNGMECWYNLPLELPIGYSTVSAGVLDIYPYARCEAQIWVDHTTYMHGDLISICYGVAPAAGYSSMDTVRIFDFLPNSPGRWTPFCPSGLRLTAGTHCATAYVEGSGVEVLVLRAGSGTCVVTDTARFAIGGPDDLLDMASVWTDQLVYSPGERVTVAYELDVPPDKVWIYVVTPSGVNCLDSMTCGFSSGMSGSVTSKESVGSTSGERTVILIASTRTHGVLMATCEYRVP